MILLCPSAKAAAADPVSFRLSPLHCTVLAFVLRVAWSPPHGRWLIRLYNDERTLHLDLRYFHATGYAPWWRDHLFIGRQDDLCTLAACGLHVGIFVSCHVSILPLASSSTKTQLGIGRNSLKEGSRSRSMSLGLFITKKLLTLPVTATVTHCQHVHLIKGICFSDTIVSNMLYSF